MLFVLGMVFHVGWQKAVKGGVTMGIGLFGLFMVLDKIIGAMNPVITAIATRFHIAKAIIDVNWADSGLCWSWPGVPAVLLGTLVINGILVLLRLQKTLWTDLWSFWHGESMGAIAWGLSDNVMIGVATGIIYLIIGAWLSDLTAKKYQEFNEMPVIGVPCGPTIQASIAAIPIVWVLDRIPGIKDWDVSPEMMRKKLGLFGETSIQGLIIGLEIVKDQRKKTPGPEESMKIREICREEGILLGHGGVKNNIIRIQPPLIVSREQINQIVVVLDKCISTIEKGLS